MTNEYRVIRSELVCGEWEDCRPILTGEDYSAALEIVLNGLKSARLWREEYRVKYRMESRPKPEPWKAI